MEAEVRRRTSVGVCGLKTVMRARDHEPGLAGGQIVDASHHPAVYVSGYIHDRDAQTVTLVHQQRLFIGREAGIGEAGESRRPRRNAIPLNEREVGGFRAIGIELPVGDFKAVDVQGRAPMRQITTDLRDEGREARWIELHFEKRGARLQWVVAIAVGNASAVWKRTRIAEGHAEPKRNEVFETLCCR